MENLGSKIIRVDYHDNTAPALFAQSLKTTGFGAIRNHPIDIRLIETVYARWQEFFSAPESAKTPWLFDKQKQDGYFPFRSENAKNYAVKDLKEFYHVYSWGRIPDSVAAPTRELFSAMMSLGSTLLKWIDDQAPKKIREQFSMRLPEMITNSSQNLFRVIHYPPHTGSEESGAVRAAAHEDINLITLLPASTAMGLQVLDSEGEWHNVASDWGEIVINVGDMLQMASQGYYKSTTHRVVNPAGPEASRPRYSMPLFVHARPDVRLSERHTAGSYLDERLKEIGLK